MKTSVSFAYCLAIVTMVFASNLAAQQPIIDGTTGGGGQVYEPTAGVVTGMADYRMPVFGPGRIWFGTNIADQTVGQNGIYASLGLKNRLFKDRFDGRWLTEVRLHQSLEGGGGFFTNLGLERVFSIDAANADVSVGAWFDYDSDTHDDFSHAFYQVGVSASIKTRNWDLIGNGYFPSGTTNYSQGDPTGDSPFWLNSIVLVPGIDSALEGFDATLRVRPRALSYVNGSFDIGGYGYSSDLVDFFGGGRARLNAQLRGGLIVSSEISYDERFDLTGGVNLTYLFGGGARGAEYSGIGRDLERTVRNDHVVRYNQDVVLAIDPDTGRAYNVWHVDNLAAEAIPPSTEDGTVENPFSTMAQAEARSGEDDIIWVNGGDGTPTGLDTGIQLRNGQQLLGNGIAHLIDIDNGPAFGPSYLLFDNLDGQLPTLTGRNNGAAVDLANRNTVSGFVIDGSQAVGGMGYGIRGNGITRGSRINGVTIEDNFISGAILDGVRINHSEGDFSIAQNVIGSGAPGNVPNGRHGFVLQDHDDPGSSLVFEDNTFVDNTVDGVLIDQYTAGDTTVNEEAVVLFENNTFSGNLRNGAWLNDNASLGVPFTTVRFEDNLFTTNGEHGINVTNGNGDLRVLDNQSVDNGGAGVRIVDWTNDEPAGEDYQTVIGVTNAGTFAAGTSSYTGNGIGVEVILNGNNQELFIGNSTINSNNIVGMRTTANGTGTSLKTTVLDNLSVSNNSGDGMRFSANDGASQTVVVDQVNAGTLDMTGNGSIAGDGIALYAGNDAGGAISSLDVTLRNVNVSGSGGNGVQVTTFRDGQTNLRLLDAAVSGNAGNGVDLFMDANFNNVVNQIYIQDSTFNTNASNGLLLQTLPGTFTDLVLVDNDFSSNGNAGLTVQATGDSDPADPFNNRTRLQMQGNTVGNNFAEGISIQGSGNARMLAFLENNTVSTNGFGDGANLPFFRGIDVTMANNSVLGLDIKNNLVTGNAEAGLFMTTLGNGTIFADLVDNNLGGNDVQGDPAVAGVSDMAVINSANGEVCLAMSNNSLSIVPPALVNLGPAVFFKVELDGLTNGFGEGDLGGGFDFPPYGTVCRPAIEAEEAAFEAAGFPPLF